MRNRCLLIVLIIGLLTGCVGTPPVGKSFHYTPQSSQPHWFSDSAVFVRSTPSNFIQYLEEPFEKAEFLSRIRTEHSNKRQKALSIKEKNMALIENALTGIETAEGFAEVAQAWKEAAVVDPFDIYDDASNVPIESLKANLRLIIAQGVIGIRDFQISEYSGVISGIDKREEIIERFVLESMYSSAIAIFDIARAEDWCKENQREEWCEEYKSALEKVDPVYVYELPHYAACQELTLSFSPTYYVLEAVEQIRAVLGSGDDRCFVNQLEKSGSNTGEYISFPKKYVLFKVAPGKKVRGTKYY